MAHPVGVWPLLAVSRRGLTVVARVTEKPNLMGGIEPMPLGPPDGGSGPGRP